MFSTSKCDVGNWIFSKSWEFLNFGGIFGEFFGNLGGFFWEFFENFWGIFGEFLGNFLGIF